MIEDELPSIEDMNNLFSLLELERLADPDASDDHRVRTIARRIIEELGVVAPPMNVEMIASYLDIRDVVVDHELDVAGCLICRPNGRAQIRVRGADTRDRRRFTVCHECAHTFFPGYAHQPQYRCAPSMIATDRGVEGLCDVAASELLLPERLFRPGMRELGFSLEAVEELATNFRASLAATASRFVQSAEEAAAFLTFEERTKPAERASVSATAKLRLQSAVAHGDWPFFRRHKSVLADDVFDRARQGEIVFEPKVIVAGLTATPLEVEVHAQLYPYSQGVTMQPRVLALLRRPRSSNGR